MRLADFILSDREAIMVEWEAFARSCAPASNTMNVEALRDHASEMLTVIAADLATPQGEYAQSQKSKGRAPDVQATEPTAAEEHGSGRSESGFTVAQMIAEYRALRASVIRLWTKERGTLGRDEIEDLTRFHEAIDQALAESVSKYDRDQEQAKEIFLAILGHDLRLPLGAIYMSAKFMLELDDLPEPHRSLTTRMVNSAQRTLTMVGDLLDFTRGRLGGGIPVARTEVNLGRIVHDVVDEARAAHPDRPMVIETRGEQMGQWDSARISQALANLIGNAVQHGAGGTPITVRAAGDEEEAIVTVHNSGSPITPDRLNGIFNPLKARTATQSAPSSPTASLGLGLYIAERIVTAHDGRIVVDSTEAEGTTVTLHLPRREKPARRGAAPEAVAAR